MHDAQTRPVHQRRFRTFLRTALISAALICHGGFSHAADDILDQDAARLKVLPIELRAQLEADPNVNGVEEVRRIGLTPSVPAWSITSLCGQAGCEGMLWARIDEHWKNILTGFWRDLILRPNELMGSGHIFR